MGWKFNLKNILFHLCEERRARPDMWAKVRAYMALVFLGVRFFDIWIIKINMTVFRWLEAKLYQNFPILYLENLKLDFNVVFLKDKAERNANIFLLNNHNEILTFYGCNIYLIYCSQISTVLCPVHFSHTEWGGLW